MHRRLSRTALVASLLAMLPLARTTAQDEGDEPRLGHSAHGEVFDEGPRQRPWKLEDIGRTHFKVTTSVPEVQEWFDQGNTLLHSFWYFEAERAFRWCLKLDPDCAMAWWGLSRAARGDRTREFLEEALERKDTVTERERRYLEAWEEVYAPELSGAVEVLDEEGRKQRELLAEKLELIVMDYPDDVEAKALLALYSLYHSTRAGNEFLIRTILEKEPLHPGAHHYRIHNWDGPDGRHALDSCEVYGQLASYVGHANHMPGHVYSGIGMWHDGAFWMDRATRVEKRYMQERLILPFNHWNYAHNRNYLSFIQEQLGMAEAALDGARQLLAAPLDPEYNERDKDFNIWGQGLLALRRGLLKFERWEAVLDDETIPWRDKTPDRMWRAYAEGLAHLGLGDVEAAIADLIELKELEGEVEKDGARSKGRYDVLLNELRGLVALATDETLKGLGLLEEAAAAQLERYHGSNDPPAHPRIVSTVLGEAHLELGSPALAAAAFERTLETVKNDGFALSGLVRARHALGDEEGAADAWGRFCFVWSDADPGLRWVEDARALGLQSEEIDDSPRPQRRYAEEVLARFGPETWEPYPAPHLDALDPDLEPVTLEDYRGRNVLLVFFLGEECAHCVEQLVAIDERIGELEERDVQVLAISSDTPEENRTSLKMGELGFRLLSDEGFENARRFRSYDDFEEIELHSTIFIGREGRVRWARTGGEPFTDLDFLLAEIDRVDDGDLRVSVTEASASTEGGQ